MENYQNEKNVKNDNLKLHFIYVVVICFIICIGTIIIAAHNQESFVSQVSFAGTITSIVLSVIAIWMSISGERSTNDIRIKIAESTERLSDTTKNVEILNKNYENTMDTQLNELKKVQEQLTKVIFSINSVGEQVSHLQEKSSIISTTIDKQILNTTQRITIFNTIYTTWFINKEPYLEWLFCMIIYIFITRYNKNRGACNLNNILYDLSQFNVDINLWMKSIDIYWGIFNTLLAASVFDDETAVNQIFNQVNSKINPIIPSSFPL